MAKIGYLAGGMKSGWQDQVIAALPEIEWLDPRTHGFTEERDYTAWDVDAIRRADLILAYMEPDNPGGHGLALEIGVAAGLNLARTGRHTWIVLADPSGHRHLGMARALSDSVVPSLDVAIALTRRMLIGGPNANA